MYKYINIQYEIFLIKFVYSKITSFYIKKYFLLKNSVKKFWFQYYSVRFSVFKKIQKKFRFFTIRLSNTVW